MLVVTSPRRSSLTCLGVVRVCGTDAAELVAAARLIGSAVMATRRGVGWFDCPVTAVPLVRDKVTTGSPSLASWFELIRGGRLVSPVAGGPARSTLPGAEPDAGAPIPPAPVPAPPSLSAAADS